MNYFKRLYVVEVFGRFSWQLLLQAEIISETIIIYKKMNECVHGFGHYLATIFGRFFDYSVKPTGDRGLRIANLVEDQVSEASAKEEEFRRWRLADWIRGGSHG